MQQFVQNTAVFDSLMTDQNVVIFYAKNGALFLAAAAQHLELVKMLIAVNVRDITKDAVYHLDNATNNDKINRAITFLLRIPNTIERHYDRRIMTLWQQIIDEENTAVKNGNNLYMTISATGRYKYDDIKEIIKFWPDLYLTASVIDTNERTLERFMDRICGISTRTEGCPCRNCSVDFHVRPKGYSTETSNLIRSSMDTFCFGLCIKKNGLCKKFNCLCHCTICTEKWFEKLGENKTTCLENSFTESKTNMVQFTNENSKVRFANHTTTRYVFKGVK